jgi:hypothetical protein
MAEAKRAGFLVDEYRLQRGEKYFNQQNIPKIYSAKVLRALSLVNASLA